MFSLVPIFRMSAWIKEYIMGAHKNSKTLLENTSILCIRIIPVNGLFKGHKIIKMVLLSLQNVNQRSVLETNCLFKQKIPRKTHHVPKIWF